MKKNNKLALLLVSLMTFSGCEVIYVNTSSPSNQSSSTISSLIDTSSDVSSDTSSDASSDTSSDASSDTSSDTSSSQTPSVPTINRIVWAVKDKQTFSDFNSNKSVKDNKE